MTQVRDVSMILARDLASKLATPMFLVDPQGDLLFYNEPAERILGRTFAESGQLPAAEWAAMFSPEDAEGRAVAPGDLPLGMALRRHRPAHRPLVITGADGERRRIEVTAFPILPHPGQLAGAVAIFWEADEA